MSSSARRRVVRRGLVGAGAALLLLSIAAAFVLLNKPGNISHPSVEFTIPTRTHLPEHHEPVFTWPLYGYDAARAHAPPLAGLPLPPLRRGWRFDDHALLEFPPVLHAHSLYLLDFNGSVKAVDTRNGRRLWRRRVGSLAAASPALDMRHRLVFVPLLSTAQGARAPGHGRLVALSMKSGRIVWSRAIEPGSESSPLVHDGAVVVGDQAGAIRSFKAANGHLNWTFHASGAVKGGLALARGHLFFGDYAGRAYALAAATGRQIWAISTNGSRFGFGSGTFYASPAVAFGRVYLGNTDGRVYSFAQATGRLGWATETGGYVYSSATVKDVSGLGPTVYAGSYDGNFYAFNARSGAIRWVHHADGKISGSSTILGDVIYYPDLGTKHTVGLDVRTGRKVFSWGDGAFASAIADAKHIYLVGYTTVYQMSHKRSKYPANHARRSPRHRTLAQRSRKRRR